MDRKNLNLIFKVIFLILLFLILNFIFFNSIFNSSEIQNKELNLSMSFEQVIISNNISNCNYVLENLIESCKLRLSVCENDSCFFEKARFEKDESLCFKIVDSNLVASCILDIKRNLIFQKSVLEDNIDICQDFEDEANINFCRDNYYLSKRHNLGDFSYCEHILLEELKNACYN